MPEESRISPDSQPAGPQVLVRAGVGLPDGGGQGTGRRGLLSFHHDRCRPSEPYLYLAECLAALGDREGAAETLKKAVAAAEPAGSARSGRRAAIMLEALERNGREEG
jgi:hypothetical protein